MGISASRVLLLLLMLIPGNLNFHLSKRPDVPKKNVKRTTPSCGDLLSMWHQMNLMTRHSLSTNEIPVFPRNFLDLLLGVSQAHPQSPSRTSPHFRNTIVRPNTIPEDELSPFAKSFQDGDTDRPLRLGLPENVDPFFGNRGGSPHRPKNIQGTEYDPQLSIPSEYRHPLTGPTHGPRVLEDSQTGKLPDNSIIYQRAFPLDDATGLFGSLGNPYEEETLPSGSGLVDTAIMLPKSQLPGQVTGHDTVPIFEGPIYSESRKPVEEDAMGIFGTVLHDTEEEEKWNEESGRHRLLDPTFPWLWGENVGTFGDFVPDSDDEDEDDPKTATGLHKTISSIQKGKGASDVLYQQPFLSGPETGNNLPLITCTARTDGLCNRDADCACVGWVTLKCMTGKCRPEDTLQVSEGFDFGTWHERPLPSSELGPTRVRRVLRNPWTPM